MYPIDPDVFHSIPDFWLSAFSEEPISQPGTDEQEVPVRQAEEEDHPNIYHVYMVKEPGATSRRAHHPIWHDENEPAEEGPSPSSLLQQSYRLLLPLALVALLVIGVLAGTLVAYLTQATSAQVTVLPARHAITITTTLTVITGSTTSSSMRGQDIAGRALPTMTLSQASTIPTSGTGHQDATPAHGLLTFYNGLPTEQTISAGTLLTSSTGVQVITDEDAGIPAASLPTSGQVSVAAHTLIVGPEGNLPAEAVSMPCCRENVYVRNDSSFSGGQLARTF
jgi:hypothetical protein